MNGSKQESGSRTEVMVETTDCPECGTSWEVVVTERTRPRIKDRDEE